MSETVAQGACALRVGTELDDGGSGFRIDGPTQASGDARGD